MEYIDYVVLMGDTSVLWNDLFPIGQNEKPATPSVNSGEKEMVA
jgi:hypothetical protein